jgi:transcriptional regulator with XRE-family HTH domain
MTTDWTQLLADLKARGWMQKQLAELAGTSQSSISDLASGKTLDPAHSIGSVLEALHKSAAIAPPTTTTTERA